MRPLSLLFGAGGPLILVLALSWLAVLAGIQGCSISASDLLATVDRRPLLLSLRDSVIVPRAERFLDRAAALQASAQALAAAPGAARLDSAKSRWKEAAGAWAALQPARVGPIADASPRLDFWPVRPNLIEAGLAASDKLDSQRIATLTPAAARGLPALEWLLFATPADSLIALLADSALGARRRDYLTAAAADLRGQAAGLLGEWKGTTGARFADPASGARWTTTQAAVADLIKGLVASLEEMKNAKAGVPWGTKSGGKAQPNLVESPYAYGSLAILAANLDGVEAVFEGGDATGINDYLDDLGSSVPARVRKGIADARAALNAVPSPLSSAVSTQPAKVEALYNALRDLVVLVKNDAASALGVTITFTDSDGD